MDDLQAFNLMTLFLRVSLGAMIFVHGFNKAYRGGKIAGTAAWFDSIGLKPGKLHAQLSAYTEMGSGILLIVGLATQLADGALVALMVVAAVTVHLRSGFLITKGGWEYNYIIAVAAIVSAGLGAGEWSLDHLFDLPFADMSLGAGMALATGLGVGGAAGLLGIFWRPPSDA
ncbi:MAG: DoxX family protein [Actinobacteria bacterium]|nr:DoxX family protein [Actinomycetota bacterium]MCB9388780.1 DoxX family protein [Acidimicrobiia bacterium]